MIEATTFSPLYGKGKGGAIQVWMVSTQESNIIVRWGQLDGAKQTTIRRATPKNEGRSNATTAERQAWLEAKALWQHKLDRKYSLTMAGARECTYLPMLAHSFADHAHKISWPAYVQPKLDGFRCLAFRTLEGVELLSRSGKVFKLPHIEEELRELMQVGDIFDGELYAHGYPFQTVASWIKRAQPLTKLVRYHVYDMPETAGLGGDTFEERFVDLTSRLNIVEYKKVSPVPTYVVASGADVVEYAAQFVKMGFEGAMVRTLKGKYVFGYRSHDLLKMKIFDDEEFVIVGGRSGEGKFEGMAVFTCAVGINNATFDVMPTGSAEQRRWYLTHLNQLIGRHLTVKFFGKSEESIPRFPVGLKVRDMEVEG